MSPISEKTLSNRTSSRKYYEKYVFHALQCAKNTLIRPRNKEKEREKARLRMAALRSNARMAVSPVDKRFPIQMLFERWGMIELILCSALIISRNKQSECEKARRHLALLKSKRSGPISLSPLSHKILWCCRMLEAHEANESLDLSYLDGEGDEHLKDTPALEIWCQTFKRDMTAFLVRLRYQYVIQISSIHSCSHWTDGLQQGYWLWYD